MQNLLLIILPHHHHHNYKVIARVHSVHLMDVDQHQAAADPPTKPPDLDCEPALYAAIVHNHNRHLLLLYYLARKLILIYRPTTGRRLS